MQQEGENEPGVNLPPMQPAEPPVVIHVDEQALEQVREILGPSRKFLRVCRCDVQIEGIVRVLPASAPPISEMLSKPAVYGSLEPAAVSPPPPPYYSNIMQHEGQAAAVQPEPAFGAAPVQMAVEVQGPAPPPYEHPEPQPPTSLQRAVHVLFLLALTANFFVSGYLVFFLSGSRVNDIGSAAGTVIG
jgi:hypothetical protein